MDKKLLIKDMIDDVTIDDNNSIKLKQRRGIVYIITTIHNNFKNTQHIKYDVSKEYIEERFITFYILYLEDYLNTSSNDDLKGKITKLKWAISSIDKKILNQIIDFISLEIKKDLNVLARKNSVVKTSALLSADKVSVLKNINLNGAKSIDINNFKSFIDDVDDSIINKVLHNNYYYKNKLRVLLLEYLSHNNLITYEDKDYLNLLLFLKLNWNKNIPYDTNLKLLKKNNLYNDFKYYYSNRNDVKLKIDKDFNIVCSQNIASELSVTENYISEEEQERLKLIYEAIK